MASLALIYWDGDTSPPHTLAVRILNHEVRDIRKQFCIASSRVGRIIQRKAKRAFNHRNKLGLPLLVVCDASKSVVWACCQPNEREVREAITLARSLHVPRKV